MNSPSRRRRTYTSFLADMLGTLQTLTIPEVGPEPPLRGLHLTSTDDLVVGVLRAWATVADVLTFYQERLANEGYLRTATQPESIVELAHMIGYQPAQPLAASTYLAFTVGGGVGIPNQLTVPIGTRVQSVPGPSERPQVFETVEALPMYAEWSDLTPAPAQRGDPPPIQTGSTELMLDGINLRLTPGDVVLMVDENTYRPPVQHLVWGTQLPVFVHGRFRPLTSVEPIRSQQRTRVRWETPLDGATLTRPAAFVFRKRAHFFGFDAADWNSLSQQTKARASSPVGGLFHSSDGGSQWTVAANAATTRDIRALVFDAAGHVFAATAGDGVLRSSDGGVNWQQVNTGLVRKDVHALAVDANGALYAGSSAGGVVRSVDAGDSWAPLRTENNLQLGRQGLSATSSRLPNTVVRGLAVIGTSILAATDNGMFRATVGGNGWEMLTDGLPAAAQLTTLLSIPNGPLIVGTNQGAFVSTNQGSSWTGANTGLPTATRVIALVAQGGSVFAASDQGLFVSAAQTQLRWTRATAPAGSLQVLAAATAALFVGTDQGVARSTDGGATWQTDAVGLSGQRVQALAVGGDGSQLVVAEQLSVATGDQWPGFALPQDSLDLDATYATVQSGGWCLVAESNGQAGLFPVLHAQRVLRQQFGQRAHVTSIATKPDPQLATFDRRTAIVYVSSHALQPAVDALGILQDAAVTLSGVLAEPLIAGRAVALTGKRPHGRLAPVLNASPQLLSDDGREHVALQPGEVVEVLAAPASAPNGLVLWRLRHHSGLVGSVTLHLDELAWAAADADSEQVSEILWVAACSADDGSGHAQITFTGAPRNAYDAATVHLNGNVALATHGETVQEVLGSGDATQSHQEFRLKKPPVTRYILPGQVEPTSTLRVWANRVAWQPADALIDLDAHSHAYSIQTDQDGSVHIIFGDGTRGARLPSGTENVLATYRTGAGPDGEVRAGSLAQLMTRPLGVRNVTNPVAASGAAPAEGTDLVRERAPLALLRRERIVALRDYAQFASGRPDVSNASVQRLHVRGRPLIHVTVAPSPGSSLATDELASAIRAAQATPEDVQVDICAAVVFGVSVRIVPDSLRLVDNLLGDVRAKLLASFSLPARNLTQPVAASDVVCAVQSVDGVDAVDLVLFDYAAAAPARVQPRLEALPARFDRTSGRILPGQLLMLDSDHLTVDLA